MGYFVALAFDGISVSVNISIYKRLQSSGLDFFFPEKSDILLFGRIKVRYRTFRRVKNYDIVLLKNKKYDIVVTGMV